MTVQGPRRRADVALPARVPILEFTPMLAALCEAADPGVPGPDVPSGNRKATPPAWTLARVGEPPLELGSCLADAGVLDGEVLHFVDAARWRPPVVADLAEAVSGALETSGWAGEWRPPVLALLGAAFLVAAGVTAAMGGGGRGAGIVLALLTAAGLAAAAVAWRPAGLATRLGCVTGSVGLAAVAGWAIGGAHGAAGSVALAAAAAAVVLLATWAVAPAFAPGAALLLAVVGAGAGAVALGAAPARVAAVVTVGAVVLLRMLPWLVSRAFVAWQQRSDPAAVGQSARGSRRLLDSLSAGTILALLGGALTLLEAGDGYGAGLAAVGAGALLLCAQGYRFAPEALPPALAGAGAVLALAVVPAWRLLSARGYALLAGVLLAGAGIGLVLLSRRRTIPSVPAGMTRWAWLAVDLALGPLILGQLGVYAAAAGVVRNLVH